MKINPKSLVRTCLACPSQWNGQTEDNRPVYVRYRWDHLTVRIGEVNETVDQMLEWNENHPWPTPILDKTLCGDEMSGFLDNQELHAILIENNLSSDPSVVLENEPPMEIDLEALESLMEQLSKKKQ